MTIEQKAKRYDEALERAIDFKDGKAHYSLKPGESIVNWIFPELRESGDEGIKKEIIEIVMQPTWKTEKEFLRRKELVAWLEKQGEQKVPVVDFKAEDWYVSKVDGKIYDMTYNPTDKVEPKFHEGDWVVYECGEETATLQITRIVGETYVFSDDSTLGVVDEDALRMWDITKDAKDGNVLHSPSHRLVWIYKDNEHYHVCINMNYVTENIAIDGLIKIPSDVCPATSVQCAILFSKMEEAGYKWNAEKLELKKAEDEEYNGEDYGIDSLFHAQRILEKTLGKVDGYQTDDGILAHQCAISAVKKLYEHKPTDEEMKTLLRTEYEKGKADAIAEMQNHAWSEEDEKMLCKALYFLDAGYNHFTCTDGIPECKDWLKSLKDRVQPKQEWSEEDIRNIENIDSVLFYDKDLPEDTCVRLRNWLKSLKDRYTWKPSDEQMKALHDLNLTGNISYAGQGQVLIELYKQLEKL